MIRQINGISLNPVRNLTGSSFNVGATELILNSVLLPANTLSQYDILGIQTRVLKETALGGSFTTKIRIGTGLTTSSTQVAIFSTATSSVTIVQIDRRLSIQNLTTDTRVFPTTVTTTQSDTAGELTVGMSTVSIDWTLDNYIIVSATCSVTEQLSAPYIITDIIQPGEIIA